MPKHGRSRVPDAIRPVRVLAVAAVVASMTGLALVSASCQSVGARARISSARGSGPGTASPAAPTSAARADAVADVLRQALLTQQRMVVPPNAVPGKHPSEAELDRLEAAGKTRLSTLFLGPLLSREEADLHSAVGGLRRRDFQSLDAGIDSFRVSHVQEQDHATVVVKGSYRAWATVAQIGVPGARPATPRNMIDFVARVTLDGSTWKVSDLDWTFHAGSEP